MMDVMGDYINFFRKSFNYQILGDQPEYRMAETIGFMSTISMKPNGSMGAHDDHGVYNQHYGGFPI
jgi:hypothetical protein